MMTTFPSLVYAARASAAMLACAVLFLSLPAELVGAEFAGGTGEPNDPYQIATAEQLISVGKDPNLMSKCFVLVSDIDLNPNLPGGEVFTQSLISPVTTSLFFFRGSLDGRGHAIRNLTMNVQTGPAGLIGYMGSRVVVRNLGIEGARVTGKSAVGALAGYLLGGTISSCYSTGEVAGENAVGGLVGHEWDGSSVSLSHSSATVTAAGICGGLVGYNDGSISSSHSSGPVSSETGSAGGLVGRNIATIGYNNGWISFSYSSGPVSSTAGAAGGLVGDHNGGSISFCYSSGVVGSTEGTAGGLIGRTTSTKAEAYKCFWDKEASGCSTSTGGTGVSTAQMKDIGTYLDAGWDFVGESANGTSQLWQMPENGYPVPSRLTDYRPVQLKGQGTSDDPYQVSSPAELGAIVWYDPASCYSLTADIDLAGIRWSAAVIPVLTGRFDGNGHVISNLRITGTSYVGLFGSAGNIRDLGLVNANVVGLGSYVGALAGTAADVHACYSTGLVTGQDLVGGLIGASSGTVSRCYSMCAVTSGRSGGGLVATNSGTLLFDYSAGSVTTTIGTAATYRDEQVGGLVGNNGGTIYHCFSTSSVLGSPPAAAHISANAGLGGLVGYNASCVAGCYSAGLVAGGPKLRGLIGEGGGVVSNCFWDMQTSGCEFSAGGTGLLTSQMKDIQTYLAAGWDCVGEIANGTSDLWQMPDGGGYPIPSVLAGHQPIALKGQGTQEDPYQISSAVELGAIVWYPSSACYQLIADIDLSATQWSTAIVPVFGGVFDGQGYGIISMKVVGGCYLGLFGSSGGQIMHVRVDDANVVGQRGAIGVLAGRNMGAILDCHVTGSVVGTDAVGGLVGQNERTITDCSSQADVAGRGDVGGLAGSNKYGTCSNCWSTGTVTGEAGTGGLVGYNAKYGHVHACHSGCIVGRGTSVGGLVGTNEGDVSDSFSTGAARGQSDVGGLLGYNTGSASAVRCYSTGSVNASTYRVGGFMGFNGGTVSDCYSAGPATGNAMVAGLAGTNRGQLSNSYSTGKVNAQSLAGGLVADNVKASVNHCFWDIETSSQSHSAAGEGKTTAQMQTSQTFLDAGWDLAGTWMICEGKGYPKLRWENAQCTGTE